jgi:hypothetical protein
VGSCDTGKDLIAGFCKSLVSVEGREFLGGNLLFFRTTLLYGVIPPCSNFKCFTLL